MRSLILLAFLLLFGCSPGSKKERLRQTIQEIIGSTDATVGVGMMDLATGDTLTINGSRHFPMQSVYKFHLAMSVLSQVDLNVIPLSHQIFVAKKDLRPDTHSPMRDDFPQGETTLTLTTVLAYTVSKSDNNGCDILFRLVGGPSFVNEYIKSLGIPDIAITATEEQMHGAWDVQFANWTTPASMIEVLEIFASQRRLSKASTELLWKMMVETPTGSNRIKAPLPQDAVVAHKTGYSGANDQGVTAAVNDVGIVRLPDGRQYIIAVFVSNTKASLASSEKVIADISKATLDYFDN